MNSIVRFNSSGVMLPLRIGGKWQAILLHCHCARNAAVHAASDSHKSAFMSPEARRKLPTAAFQQVLGQEGMNGEDANQEKIAYGRHLAEEQLSSTKALTTPLIMIAGAITRPRRISPGSRLPQPKSTPVVIRGQALIFRACSRGSCRCWCAPQCTAFSCRRRRSPR